LLMFIERDVAAEKRALEALAGWAEQFSSDICLDTQRWLVWLEVGASATYFGSLPCLLATIQEGVAALDYSLTLGVAPTLEAAALLARPELGSKTRIVPTREALLSLLESLPAQLLAIPAESFAGLRDSGIASIGAVLKLPRSALARRFGPALTAYLQRLIGAEPEARARHKSPGNYRRRCEFAVPVDSVESLLFPLRHLLFEFQGWLRSRDAAVQSIRLQLLHRAAPPTVLRLRTTDPERRAVRLFALLRERLGCIKLPEPVCEIRLKAEQCIAPGDTQLSLFEDRAQREANWSALLDKLHARLGEAAVRRLGLSDDHRPEKAWCIQAGGADTPLPPAFPARPLWLCDARPVRRLPRLMSRPERIEAGWWNDEDSSRDYYIAATDAGARWWLYRDVATNQWFLQGLWA